MALKIPREAKKAVERAINANFKLTPSKRAGTPAGRDMAIMILRKKELPLKQAKRVASFHKRFKKCKTLRCKIVKGLWGGPAFGLLADRYVRRFK